MPGGRNHKGGDAVFWLMFTCFAKAAAENVFKEDIFRCKIQRFEC